MRYVTTLLTRLGYRARLKVATPTKLSKLQSATRDSPARAQVLGIAGWGPDYPAASDFFALSVDSFTCGASMSALCEPRLERQIRRAARIESREPRAADALWGEHRSARHGRPRL
jgi:hypothetical protein